MSVGVGSPNSGGNRSDRVRGTSLSATKPAPHDRGLHRYLRRPYANKLLRLQLDLIQVLNRHRRGHKQTMEVGHLHIHPGGQDVVRIVNTGEREEVPKNDTRPHTSGRHSATAGKYGQSAPMRG